MSDVFSGEAMLGPASEYPYENVAIPRFMPRAAPCERVIDRWLGEPANGQSPEWTGPLVDGLREMALQEAAVLVCAQSRGLVITEAQLISSEGAPSRRIESSARPHTVDNLARALLAGPVAACIADPTLTQHAGDDTWSEILDLVGFDPEYVAQLWVENVVYLTGGLTWSTVVEIADELLAAGQLSGEGLVNAVTESTARYAFWDQSEKSEFVQGLQRIRDCMLSRGSEPFQEALDKAMAAWR